MIFAISASLESKEFKSLFDEIIISSEIKMVKPYREFFEYALAKVGSTPEESLIIDDNEANVEGARALGMSGFVYADVPSLKKYLEESSLL